MQASTSPNDSLKTLTIVTYALYALTLFVGLTAVVAVIINYVKRDDVRGTLYESHFTWQIRTFWWTLLWGVVGLLTAFFMVGFLILLISGIWFLYRIIKGFLYLNDGKPMPV